MKPAVNPVLVAPSFASHNFFDKSSFTESQTDVRDMLWSNAISEKIGKFIDDLFSKSDYNQEDYDKFMQDLAAFLKEDCNLTIVYGEETRKFLDNFHKKYTSSCENPAEKEILREFSILFCKTLFYSSRHKDGSFRHSSHINELFAKVTAQADLEYCIQQSNSVLNELMSFEILNMNLWQYSQDSIIRKYAPNCSEGTQAHLPNLCLYILTANQEILEKDRYLYGPVIDMSEKQLQELVLDLTTRSYQMAVVGLCEVVKNFFSDICKSIYTEEEGYKQYSENLNKNPFMKFLCDSMKCRVGDVYEIFLQKDATDEEIDEVVKKTVETAIQAKEIEIDSDESDKMGIITAINCASLKDGLKYHHIKGGLQYHHIKKLRQVFGEKSLKDIKIEIDRIAEKFKINFYLSDKFCFKLADIVQTQLKDGYDLESIKFLLDLFDESNLPFTDALKTQYIFDLSAIINHPERDEILALMASKNLAVNASEYVYSALVDKNAEAISALNKHMPDELGVMLTDLCEDQSSDNFLADLSLEKLELLLKAIKSTNNSQFINALTQAFARDMILEFAGHNSEKIIKESTIFDYLLIHHRISFLELLYKHFPEAIDLLIIRKQYFKDIKGIYYDSEVSEYLVAPLYKFLEAHPEIKSCSSEINFCISELLSQKSRAKETSEEKKSEYLQKAYEYCLRATTYQVEEATLCSYRALNKILNDPSFQQKELPWEIIKVFLDYRKDISAEDFLDIVLLYHLCAVGYCKKGENRKALKCSSLAVDILISSDDLYKDKASDAKIFDFVAMVKENDSRLQEFAEKLSGKETSCFLFKLSGAFISKDEIIKFMQDLYKVLQSQLVQQDRLSEEVSDIKSHIKNVLELAATQNNAKNVVKCLEMIAQITKDKNPAAIDIVELNFLSGLLLLSIGNYKEALLSQYNAIRPILDVYYSETCSKSSDDEIAKKFKSMMKDIESLSKEERVRKITQLRDNLSEKDYDLLLYRGDESFEKMLRRMHSNIIKNTSEETSPDRVCIPENANQLRENRYQFKVISPSLD